MKNEQLNKKLISCIDYLFSFASTSGNYNKTMIRLEKFNFVNKVKRQNTKTVKNGYNMAKYGWYS